MLRDVQRVGISEDADGVVDVKGVVDAGSVDGSGVILGVLAAGARMGDGSGVPKAGMAGATEDVAIVERLVSSPSSRRASTAARAAEVFAIFLLEKAAV
jgi:hypothetical protein